jgi:hypothetical protein
MLMTSSLATASDAGEVQQFTCRGIALGYARFTCTLKGQTPVIDSYCKLMRKTYQRFKTAIPREALAVMPREVKNGILDVRRTYPKVCP